MWRAVGALLGTSSCSRGTVRKRGIAPLRITAQLTSTDDGQLPSVPQRYDRTLRDVFEIQDEIAATIVNTLRATMFADVSEHVPRRYTRTSKPTASISKAGMRGTSAPRKASREAISYFEQAIAEDPGYAPAYAGLADSYAPTSITARFPLTRLPARQGIRAQSIAAR